MKHTKRLAGILLALVMALTLAVPAMAAGFEPAETAVVYFGGSSVAVYDEEEGTGTIPTHFNGYHLMTLKTTLACKEDHTHTMGCYSYAYTINGKYEQVLLDAANAVKADGVAAITKDTLIDFMESMDADTTQNFADALYRGIEKNNLSAEKEHITVAEIDQGYWLFVPVVEDNDTWKDADGQKVLLDTKGIPEIKVDPKPIGTPEIDKEIDGASDTDPATDGKVKYNSTSVGDKVPYVLTSKVPDMSSYEKYFFVVSDTLSEGLTFNDDVAIAIGNKTLEQGKDFTVTATKNANGTTSVEIVFKNFIQYKDQKGTGITITYSATVNENAVIGAAGNPNKVTLKYSNNPYVEDNGVPGDKDKPSKPTGETPEQETRTYVTGIQLTKVDPNGDKLTGAKFKISGVRLNITLVNKEIFRESENGTWYRLKDGTYTETAPADGTDDLYDSTTVKYEKITVVTKETGKDHITAEGYVDTNGVLIFEGLGAGTYTITELVAPSGYNLLKEPITITISYQDPVAPSTDCTWTVSGGNATVENGMVKLTVENSTGPELPSTGGMGTTIFYVVGSILIFGAVVLLVTRKRMSHEE